MTREGIRLLLLEDNPGDVRLIHEALEEAERSDVQVEVAGRMSEALDQLDQGGFDAILSDLNLPDSEGMGTVTQLIARAPHLPVVVLTSVDDGETGSRAVGLGAADFVVKGSIDGPALVRTLSHAIERQQLQTQMLDQQMTVRDHGREAHQRVVGRINAMVEIVDGLEAQISQLRGAIQEIAQETEEADAEVEGGPNGSASEALAEELSGL